MLLLGCTWKVAAAEPTPRRVTTIDPNVPVGVAGAPDATGPLGSSAIVADTAPEFVSVNPTLPGKVGKKPPPANAPTAISPVRSPAVSPISVIRLNIARSPFLTNASITCLA